MAESLLSGADPWIALRVVRARRQRGVAPVIRYPPPRPSPSTAEGAVLGHALALKMRLLVTRPEQDAPRIAAALAARGHQVRLAPLLRIEAIADADLGAGPWDGVLLTSVNAARAAAGHARSGELRSLPALAVGRRTAEAACRAGFPEVISADGSAGELAKLAGRRFAPGKRLLYLAGTDRARDLAGELASAGITVRTVEIYRAHPAEAFPTEVAAAFQSSEIDGVLHFSRRSAVIFLACAEHAGVSRAALRAVHYCISAQVAEPLAIAGAAALRVAPQPDEDAVVALIGAA